MDGAKVLASGFDMDEKAEIEKLVTAMGGVLHTSASSDVSFVIVKNVLAAKYKWALSVLKKPIVTLSWLHQCWKEHRVVPQESYRVLPFSGLTICITNFRADDRKEIEKLATQNGGDKYKVAKKWGGIHIVTRKWLDQSVARRACLNEESYPIQVNSGSSMNTVRTSSTSQPNQNKVIGNSQCAPSSVATDILFQAVSCDGIADADLEATLLQNLSSTLSDGPCFMNKDNGAPTMQPKSDMDIDGCVADDYQSEDNDLYLSDCRILLVGFDASEMRRLVHMVCRGGGSRYMSLNKKLTHIVVGTPSETEKKEVRGLYAMGVICVVSTVWLEDCDREKKEMRVLQRHIAYNLLLPKDSVSSNKGAAMGVPGLKQGKSSTVQSILQDDQFERYTNTGSGMSSQKSKEPQVLTKTNSSLKGTLSYTDQSQFSNLNSCGKSSSVFRGRLFRFSSSFPETQREEIIGWIHEGGGTVVDDKTRKNVHFIVESHGVGLRLAHVAGATNVSTHWIRSCLQDRHLLDVGSHILFSPLQCQIPLTGFDCLHLCVSQYDEKDRLLLKNLCYILGAKFVNKLTKKATHLICKFTSGPKYEAASKWGIQTVTFEWISECVKQNGIVDTGPFSPKKATIHDREAGHCTMSQYPSQAVRMISDDASQLTSQTQDLKSVPTQVNDSRSDSIKDEATFSNLFNKRARLLEDNSVKGLLPSGGNLVDPVCISTGNKIAENAGEVSNSVPDVAAAIEDLLEQTSKIHDQKSPERTEPDKSVSLLFTSDCSMLDQDLHVDPHSAFGLSKNWMQRTNKKDDISKPPGDEVKTGIYDGFSETQTESQVVGYEEDLSGRQMIIERVRTRSGMTPNT